MKKTLNYTTLKGLLNKTKEYTLNNFKTGRVYHIKKGWVNAKLNPHLKNEIKNLFDSFLNRDVDRCNKTYGIFKRLIINKNLNVEYVAGQDYNSEIRTLKSLFD